MYVLNLPRCSRMSFTKNGTLNRPLTSRSGGIIATPPALRFQSVEQSLASISETCGTNSLEVRSDVSTSPGIGRCLSGRVARKSYAYICLVRLSRVRSNPEQLYVPHPRTPSGRSKQTDKSPVPAQRCPATSSLLHWLD